MKSVKSIAMTMLLSLLPTMLWADSEWNNTINKQSEKEEYTLSLNGSAVQSTEGYFTFGTPYSENPSRYNKFNFNEKFAGTYDDVVYTKGLKMEGSTVVEWMSTKPATVTIVQSTWSSGEMKTIKFDNNELSFESATLDEANGYYEYVVENVSVGAHTITRGSGESGLFFVKVTYNATDSSDYTFDKHNAFGWGCCSDINGTPYQLDGGWHKENPTYTILYASGGDDRQAIMEAIETFDIVVLDGSQGDFVLSENMPLRNIKHKSILGRNNARLCTQWYITSDLRQALNDANVNQYRPDAGTGGYLSNGNWVDEAREQHTRQVIIDFTGDETEVYRNAGIFKLDSSDENIIIRNLTLVGPGSVDVGGTDIISNYGATNVWIDHCDFIDGLDGNLDSGYREGSNMFATYSWNIFRYTDRSYSHSNSNLTTKTKGFQQYVTYAYNIWGEGCYSRLPRIEGSDVHLLNNYYNCLNNSAAIAIVSNSRDLVEGNYAVDGIKNPFSGGNTDAQAYWLTRNNIGFGIFDNASNTDQQIEVPYPYVCFPTADVPTLLTDANGAGPTLSYDDIILPDGEPGTIQKTVFAIKEGDTFKSGQTIELEGIALTFGEQGGADFLAAKTEALDEVFTVYTPGNDVNGNKQGGTFYVFTPQEDGTLTVAVKHNSGKPLYVEEDGIVLPNFNGITFDEVRHYTFSFPVKAGSTYKLYCAGSKLGFYGFVFKWVDDGKGPEMLTEEDYVYQKTKVNFYQRNARFRLCSSISLNDYQGIRIDIENPQGFDILIKNAEGKQQRKAISTSSFSMAFDKTILGDSISSIELHNTLNSKNETIYHLYLIKSDGSEEDADIKAFKNLWECKSEDIYVRKQFVHSIDFNGLWTELNLFDDKIPMKLKTYKGLRVEFAEPVSADNYAVKVYGDDGNRAIGKRVTTGLSTTIYFSDYSVTNEVNRVTLQHIKDGHGEAKVICVWLIRQDGIEEFCDDFSPFWGCEINSVTPMTTAISSVNVDCPVSNSGIYNLAGQRLSKPQKGINIISGKKVVFK
jgi:hypothetical protein